MSNSYAAIMTVPRMEEIVEAYKWKTPFRTYNNFDTANSYKYMGAKMMHDGSEYYFASRNLAIFFFVVHNDIQQEERDKILELFTAGYKRGYAEVETAITDKLGLQERSHANIQAIAHKMYIESYKKYDGWLYSKIDRFYAVGYNQGQLHKLKVMREGLDIIGASGEFVAKDISTDCPVHLLELKPKECQYLYTELTKNGYFLPEDTNQKHFNFIFGGGVCPDDFSPLCWNASKQALSELIILIKGKKSVPRHIQRDVAKVFVDSKNMPIGKLSNPKKDESSSDYGTLDTIAKALKTTKTHSS